MKRTIFYKTNKGLTLLEVMIALSIFAITGVIALRTCLLSTRHIQIVNNSKNLVLLAKIKIEEYKAGILNIETEKEGIFTPPFENYQWQIELTDITIKDTEYGINITPYKLTVRKDRDEYSVVTPFLKISEEDKKDEK